MILFNCTSNSNQSFKTLYNIPRIAYVRIYIRLIDAFYNRIN